MVVVVKFLDCKTFQVAKFSTFPILSTICNIFNRFKIAEFYQKNAVFQITKFASLSKLRTLPNFSKIANFQSFKCKIFKFFHSSNF